MSIAHSHDLYLIRLEFIRVNLEFSLSDIYFHHLMELGSNESIK